MTFDEYKNEILNGEKIDWYGEMVPRKLVTSRVNVIANMIVDSIKKMENEVSDMKKGKETESKERYIESVWTNIKNLPYSSNGLISDCYLIKYKKIIEEAKTQKTVKKIISNTVENKNPEEVSVVKGRRNKNKLIFGNNK